MSKMGTIREDVSPGRLRQFFTRTKGGFADLFGLVDKQAKLY
jgi:hypothetical protein